ncbi:MAG TPA: RHS repeat-associated core domain-containing protein [Bacteroidales bacterium]|nr:RHS repeat-associated core domain-containing protein [Bacteroidales bacterium]
MFDSRYKFTAKELDNETSYTYFGARYYDSDLSVWLSVDPMSDKYPSLSPYCYSADNPVVLVDPNGMWIDDYYFNTETKQISVIKTNDNFDRLIINGINKGTYNKGYLDKIANIFSSGGYSFNELEIKYTKNVDQSKISYYTRAILVDAMNKSKNNSILITSGTRTPEDQARIMKNNVDIHGMESQKSLYKAPGQQVLDYYPDQEAMTDEIYRLGPSNVSKHCGDPNKINVLDIAPSSIKYQNEFKNAILNDSRVSKLLYPPKDPALHLEIPQ